MSRRMSAPAFLSIAVPLTLGVAFLSMLLSPQGVEPIAVSEVLQALGAEIGVSDPVHEDVRSMVIRVRLPRVLIAFLAGCALAMAGTIMQALFRNPLASPEILGTAQGSALGATIAIVTGLNAVSVLWLPTLAIAGAIAVTALVYVIAGGTRGFSISSLLLAGIAMNTLVGALIAFVISNLSYDDWGQGSQILFWLMGNFDKIKLEEALVVSLGLLAFALPAVLFLRDMDLMTLKDEGASALGVNVVVVRSVLLALACALTAVTVAFTGGIAFVGLVVPHMARLVVGPVHRGLLPCAAILGAFMLLVSDFICRVLAEGTGLRVGVVMSMLGAPFFLYLLFRMRRGRQL